MILRALSRLVGEVAIWTGLVAIIAGAVALGARTAIRSAGERPWGIVAAALAGALLLAGLSDRVGLPQPMVIDVGRRPLPVAWVVGGALAGVAAFRIGRARAH